MVYDSKCLPGLACELGSSPEGPLLAQLSGVCGTPLYMEERVRSGLPYDAGADVWSLSLVLFEMAQGRLPPRYHAATRRSRSAASARIWGSRARRRASSWSTTDPTLSSMTWHRRRPLRWRRRAP